MMLCLSKRFLQTAVKLHKPTKSKNDRFAALSSNLASAWKILKEERATRILPVIAKEFQYEQGRVPSIKRVLDALDDAKGWNEIEGCLALLREMRFLGVPKRPEFSTSILRNLARIWESGGKTEDSELVECLWKLVKFESLDPLVHPLNCSEELSSDSLKVVHDTAIDLQNRLHDLQNNKIN